MMKNKIFMRAALAALTLCTSAYAQNFQLIPSGYFKNKGVDVMAFDDFYPEGHQGGISIIMNGQRIATNGDIRLEETPGQWQPVPKLLKRSLANNRIDAWLTYPDSSRHETGFNPVIYPDIHFNYQVHVISKGDAIEVTVDLDRPIPQKFIGKVGFNMEFFPGELFGKPWIMDQQSGIFPQQANSPLVTSPRNTDHPGNFFIEGHSRANIRHLTRGSYSPMAADGILAAPYATGKVFTICPDNPQRRLTIESETGNFSLIDGRMNHNNGWFVLRSPIAAGATRRAIHWIIRPHVTDWLSAAIVQTSQIGYHPSQPKQAVIETDASVSEVAEASLIRIESQGEKIIRTAKPNLWGNFLRYKYYQFDFSDIHEPGLYKVTYGTSSSSVFRIDPTVYDRGVWQPVIEYFLPIQMCHMRVNEKYRVWHGLCHMDDAQTAPTGNHIDGYDQREQLTDRQSGTFIGGLNTGGWHDAGDFDLRVESQAGESYILSLAYECFKPQIDVTAIDQQAHLTEIHQADGKDDILQQVENGVLTVVNGYLHLGRLYRGIICRNLRQYAMLGDAANMTDNRPGNDDDRWVFTESNPERELNTAAQLAASARVLKGFNDTLSQHARFIAQKLFDMTPATRTMGAKIHAAVELYLTTQDNRYKEFLLSQTDYIMRNIRQTGWYTARIARMWEKSKKRKDRKFSAHFASSLRDYQSEIQKLVAETPYGVPYRPQIWGAGWDIQRFGFEQYFLASAYPDIFGKEPIYNALHFILGCHPGSNTASFASGVGAKSATVAYGFNRADWTYIPGGVISGTALIRPDLPELLTFPYLWQQTEYVLGGGSSHYLFLVLAVKQFTKNR